MKTHLTLLLCGIGFGLPAYSQSTVGLESFLLLNIGLSHDEIASLKTGKPIVKALPARTPSEVFLFGAVLIEASPDRYFEFAHDLDGRRSIPGYLGLGRISTPPQLADWDGFALDPDDIQSLRSCQPGDCQIQLPATPIQNFRQKFDWSTPGANDRINPLLRERANERLLAYQKQGSVALGTYYDKREPFDVARQFAYMMSYLKVLPAHLPEFYQYLLDYPNGQSANVANEFYWAKVKFGLKPTLRVVHVLTSRGDRADPVAYVVAEKQLYASHYFETALDLSFCLRASNSETGFFLISILGSEQAGLSGPKGALIRKAAVGRSLSHLRDALSQTKSTLEN
jgi:hypothetical protein